MTTLQLLRASQKRSYAAFVRNTSSRPSALPSSVCASDEILGREIKRLSRQTISVIAKTKTSGLEMRWSTSDFGSVRMFLAQSIAEYRTVVSYAGENLPWILPALLRLLLLTYA